MCLSMAVIAYLCVMMCHQSSISANISYDSQMLCPDENYIKSNPVKLETKSQETQLNRSFVIIFNQEA